MENLKTRINRLIDENMAEFIAIRRDIHRHPELGHEEFRTAQLIEAHLLNWGIEVGNRINGTSVLGEIKGLLPTISNIGLRADIDALPMQEVRTSDYQSVNHGRMHACGHDVHTAIQLGAGFVLQQVRDVLPGAVKLFFQQAEETTGGAQTMIDAGVLDDPHVSHVLGLHVCPKLEVGTFGIKYDHAYASSDTITIHIHGHSAHAAAPHEGIDAIVVASNVVTALQTLVSRNTSPLESAVLSFGMIRGGEAHNIITDNVMLRGTLRTLDNEHRTYLKGRIYDMTMNIAKAYGAEVSLQVETGYDALISDEETTKIIQKVATNIFGENNVKILDKPSLGVEDFAYFTQARPSSFGRLGVANIEKQITAPLHDPEFDIDEDAIRYGILLQVMSVLELMGVNPDD